VTAMQATLWDDDLPTLADLEDLPRNLRRRRLDIDEWVYWTRIIGLTMDGACLRLGFSERRAERYEAELKINPDLGRYWRYVTAA
jgi:hypothetical protein